MSSPSVPDASVVAVNVEGGQPPPPDMSKYITKSWTGHKCLLLAGGFTLLGLVHGVVDYACGKYGDEVGQDIGLTRMHQLFLAAQAFLQLDNAINGGEHRVAKGVASGVLAGACYLTCTATVQSGIWGVEAVSDKGLIATNVVMGVDNVALTTLNRGWQRLKDYASEVE